VTELLAADDRAQRRAIDVVRAGGLVVIPTDTVYGIAADPTVAGATDGLFAVKGRPRHVPIAVLVAEEADAWAVAANPVPDAARELAARWWPGPLTLVVRRAVTWTADLGVADPGEVGTVGLRCPDHDWARRVLRRTGPLATTSANRHGEPTPPDAAGVVALLGEAADLIGLVVDGGRLDGAASTVVDCTGPTPRLVREGRLKEADLWR
jgi:tRNA threonylcarbamoyl adenosine modification protein (Sua5/YciO/YrdC/YwlC family)